MTPKSFHTVSSLLVVWLALACCNPAAGQTSDSMGLRWDFDDGTTQGFKGWHSALEVNEGILTAISDGKYQSPSIGLIGKTIAADEFDRVEVRARVEGPTAKCAGIILLVNGQSNQRSLTTTFSEVSFELKRCRGFGESMAILLRWPYCNPKAEDKIHIDWVRLGRSRQKRLDNAYQPLAIPPFERKTEWREKQPIFEEPARLYLTGQDALEKTVAESADLTDERLIGLVPESIGVPYQKCPRCGRRKFDWSLTQPGVVTCQKCSLKLPGEEFPEDKQLKIKSPGGEVITYRYWADDKGKRFFTSGIAHRMKWEFLETQLLAMSRLYLFTKRPELARRCVLVLNRLAEVFPQWCFMTQEKYKGPFSPVEKATPPFSQRTGRYHHWFYFEIPFEPLLAFDLVQGSDEFKKLSDKLDIDIRKRIEENLFAPTGEFMQLRPWQLGNLHPYMACRLAMLGRALGCPNYVHAAVAMLKQLAEEYFFMDGMWREGTVSYHMQVEWRMTEAIRYIKGYTDPEGYVDKTYGLKLRDADLMEDFPIFKKVVEIKDKLEMPDGRKVCIHDTHWRPPAPVKLGSSAQPRLLNGYGHGVLASGKGRNQIEAHLHFPTKDHWHVHQNGLNLLLFAKGKEMVSDIGYAKDKYRYFATQALAHNQVLIDEEPPAHLWEEKRPEARLALWDVSNPGCQIIESDGLPSYEHVATTYRRTLLLIRVNESDAYVVDIFRVRGGGVHDYIIHGDADHDTTFSPVSGFMPFEGGFPTKLTTGLKKRNYGLIRDLKFQKIDQRWSAQWNYGDAKSTALRITMLGSPGTEVYFGRMPSIRRANREPDLKDKFLMPVVIARRHRPAASDFPDVFTAVLQPHQNGSFIHSVRRLSPGTGNPMATGLVITTDNYVDYICASPDASDTDWRDEKGNTLLHTAARYVFARMTRKKQKVVSIHIADGKGVEAGGWQIETSGPRSGLLLKSERDPGGGPGALMVQGKLQTGETLAGRTIIVTHGDGSTNGYTIRRIESEGDSSRVFLTDDPGFEYEPTSRKSWFWFFPIRAVEGVATYHLANSATLSRDREEVTFTTSSPATIRSKELRRLRMVRSSSEKEEKAFETTKSPKGYTAKVPSGQWKISKP